MDDERIRAFLRDSLRLWQVDGVVEPGEAPVLAVISATDGAVAWVERPAEQEAPFRWAVRWLSAGEAPETAPRALRPRACGSLVGVLGALRAAFEVERGTGLRIAPAPDDSIRSA